MSSLSDTCKFCSMHLLLFLFRKDLLAQIFLSFRFLFSLNFTTYKYFFSSITNNKFEKKPFWEKRSA